MTVDLAAGLVRILDAKGQVVSAGFVAQARHGGARVITTAHVILDSARLGNDAPPPAAAWLAFVGEPDGQPRTGLVDTAAWKSPEDGDIAVLRLEEALPRSVRALPLGQATTAEGEFLTIGFPAANPDGLISRGRILGLTPPGELQLEEGTRTITAGFSGAPILAIAADRVVGMVSKLTLEDEYGGGSAAFGISTEAIVEACPDLDAGQPSEEAPRDESSEPPSRQGELRELPPVVVPRDVREAAESKDRLQRTAAVSALVGLLDGQGVSLRSGRAVQVRQLLDHLSHDDSEIVRQAALAALGATESTTSTEIAGPGEPTPARRVWLLYADGRKREEVARLAGSEPVVWGTNPGMATGDLALMYITAPRSSITYAYVAAGDSHPRSDSDELRGHVAEVTPLVALSAPLAIARIKSHPMLSGWRFAKSQQGAHRWKQDIREQGFWEALRGLLVTTNREAAEPLASWEGLAPGDVLEAAREVAEAIPDEAERTAALAELGASGTEPESQPERMAEPLVARDYWTTEDRMGASPYADAIAQFVRAKDTAPPLTIGVKAPWGAGKTSLMRMVQRRLDPPVDTTVDRWQPTRIRFTPDAVNRLKWPDDPRPARSVGGEYEPFGRVSVLRTFKRSWESPEPLRLSASGETASELEEPVKGGWRPTVWFNPWMYQTSENVWAGFAHEVIKQVTDRLHPSDRERFWLELNLRRMDREALRRRVYRVLLEKMVPFAIALAVSSVFVLGAAAASVANAATEATLALLGVGVVGAALSVLGGAWQSLRLAHSPTGDSLPALVNPPGLSALSKDLNEAFAGSLDDVFPDPRYRQRTGFLHLVQTDIRNVLDLVATPKRPLVIFVDDLDRCSPGVVAQTMEAINLFLAGEYTNVIFVLAIEPAVVAAHIDVAYAKLVTQLKKDPLYGGSTSLGWRFLDKIVQLPLSLPTPSRFQVGGYVSSLFQRPGLQTASTEVDEDRVEQITRETLRDIGPKRPTLGTLPERIADPGLALNQADQSDPIVPIAKQRVLEQLFEDSYDDQDPLVQGIVREQAGQLGRRNAREIKRLLNLFRFYSFLAVRQRSLDMKSAESQRLTLVKTARLAVLAIRWPNLLNAFAQPGNEASNVREDERMPIVLEDLEEASANDAAWEAALARVGLDVASTEHSSELATRPQADDLRKFCQDDPRIGRFARDLL